MGPLPLTAESALTNEGTITNNGTLTNSGTITNNGTLTNSGTMTNNGTVTNDGTLAVDGVFSNYAGATLNNGDTLTVGGDGMLYLQTSNTMTGNLVNNGYLELDGDGTSGTYSGNISGVGQMYFYAAAGENLTLAGDNSGFAGIWSIDTGTGKVTLGSSGSNPLGNGGATLEMISGTLDLNGHNVTATQLGDWYSGTEITDTSSGSGTTTLTLNIAPTSCTQWSEMYAGNIVDGSQQEASPWSSTTPRDRAQPTSSLGWGTLSYTGGTTINSGVTLLVGDVNTTSTLPATVTDYGTLEFYTCTTTTSFSSTINGSGNVIVDGTCGTAAMIFTGADNVTGTTAIQNGATLQLGNGTTNGTIANSIVDNAILKYLENASENYGNAISGNGQVNDGNSNTITLGSHSGFTGTTSGNIVL